MEFLESLDQGALPAIQLLRAHWVDPIMGQLSNLGDRNVLQLVTVQACIVLALFRRYRAAGLAAAAAIIAWILAEKLKIWVGRERPSVQDPLLPIPRSPSFPSGHALNAAAVYLTLAFLVATYLQQWWRRLVLVVPNLLLVFMIGVSRLYIGHHYFTDVLAGWTAGLGLALTCLLIENRLRLRGPPRSRTISVPQEPRPPDAAPG